MAYVPDAGHTTLINLFSADPQVASTVLTTEEEGVAIAAGAWLGGQRSVLLMQSSGVGNCINMLSLPVISPLSAVDARHDAGRVGRIQPLAGPNGPQPLRSALEAIGVRVVRADTAEDLIEARRVRRCVLAYEADQQIAVLIGQRLLGKKKW